MPKPPMSALEAMASAVPEPALTLIPPPAEGFLPPGLARYVRLLAHSPPSAPLHLGPGRVDGPGGPEGDMIPAQLSDGEYTVPAEVVDEVGQGDNDAGADLLDDTVEKITGVKPVGAR